MASEDLILYSDFLSKHLAISLKNLWHQEGPDLHRKLCYIVERANHLKHAKLGLNPDSSTFSTLAINEVTDVAASSDPVNCEIET